MDLLFCFDHLSLGTLLFFHIFPFLSIVYSFLLRFIFLKGLSHEMDLPVDDMYC